MTRAISVKGVGKVCVAPDQVVLQMNMVSRSEDYDGAMLMETDKLEQLAEAVNEDLLRSATENAKRKAQVLCSASGHQLGQLLSISYNWAELNIYSKTDFQLDDCEYSGNACYEPMAINPDDIKVSDSATFVWEIDD